VGLGNRNEGVRAQDGRIIQARAKEELAASKDMMRGGRGAKCRITAECQLCRATHVVVLYRNPSAKCIGEDANESA